MSIRQKATPALFQSKRRNLLAEGQGLLSGGLVARQLARMVKAAKVRGSTSSKNQKRPIDRPSWFFLGLLGLFVSPFNFAQIFRRLFLGIHFSHCKRSRFHFFELAEKFELVEIQIFLGAMLS